MKVWLYALLLAVTALLAPTCAADEAPYVPTPENLAARKWFRDAGFGVFIHWGVYSVPGRGEWVMEVEKIPSAKYEPFALDFNPEGFNADEWCEVFKRAGAKYVTITSKHHDGFAMYGTKQSDWNIVDRTPYKKDVLKQLADACSRNGLKLFFYYSQLDWHHPDYFPRGSTGKNAGRPESGDFNRYLDYMDAQLTELLSGHYGQIGGIWFDGWWDQQSKRFPDSKDAAVHDSRVEWRLRQTYDLIHRLQPSCLVGANHHTPPFPGEDFQMFEKDLPGENKAGHSPDAKVGDLPLETCDTINNSWGYNAGDQGFKSPQQLIRLLVGAAGRDANLLLNIGPRPDGTIDQRSAELLVDIGDWLLQYEPSVRPTRGGPIPPQKWGVTTQAGQRIYLHVINDEGVAEHGWLTLAGTAALPGDGLNRMGDARPLQWRRNAAKDFEVKRDWDKNFVDAVLFIDK